ncbi:MAG: glycosyltransferase [Bacteroidales bacterium]
MKNYQDQAVNETRECSKPRVLLFIDWFTPGFRAGGPTRSMVNLIERLKDQVDFYVVTRNTDYRDSTPYPGITPDVWLARDGYHVIYLSSPSMFSIRRSIHSFLSLSNSKDSHLPKGQIRWNTKAGNPSPIPPFPPSHLQTFSHSHIHTFTHSHLHPSTNPSILYLNGIWSFFFSILPLFCIRRRQFHKIILSPRGMLSSQTWVSSSLKKKLFLRLARFIGIYKDVIFHATNEQEKEDILKNMGRTVPVQVLPNLSTAVISPQQLLQKTPGEASFISIARIAPEKNTHFMLEVLQQGVEGKLTLDLYGPVYNEKYWDECKKLIAALPSNIQVTYHGTLAPENLPTATSSCHFLFMPSRGENFGHSIVECLQQGLPVLISDKTPWKNLQEKGIGWDLPLDQPQA